MAVLLSSQHSINLPWFQQTGKEKKHVSETLFHALCSLVTYQEVFMEPSFVKGKVFLNPFFDGMGFSDLFFFKLRVST